MQLPVDDDGFLRRECPDCLQEFKWHQGPTGDRPEGEADLVVCYCPRCGASAAPDQWWTQEQLAFIRESVSGHALRQIDRKSTRLNSSHLSVSRMPSSA